MCGADLQVKDGQTIATCEYCGSTQTIPNSNDERKVALYNRANSLRLASEFDKALFAYQAIVNEFKEESEAHWGVCLCRYGIEYVDDPRTGDKIPTCHRTLFESILNDEDYLEAIKYSDEVTKELYTNEAKQIDKIQKRIISISQTKEAYDVFISYKESDENNNRTKDSTIAEEIYEKLTQKGYKVFYSRISLEKKLGYEYEPIIFNALRTAKVMIVVGSKIEYFNAPWVKNEWARFLSFMGKDKEKYLVPCFIDMNAYDMPEEFLVFQSQDMSKIGAVQDLVRGVIKLVGKKEVVQVPTNAIVPNFDIYYKRIEAALKKNAFDRADWICDEVFAIDVNNAKAYFYRFLIQNKVKNIDEIYAKKVDLSNDENFKNALENASGAFKEELEKIKYNLENVAARKKYDQAMVYIRTKFYDSAIETLASIEDYADSKEQIKKVKDLINQDIYEGALNLLASNEFETAKEQFNKIIDYKDAKDKVKECEDKLIENEYQEAINNFNNGNFEVAKEIFTKHKDYKDSQNYLDNFDNEMKYQDIKKDILSAVKAQNLNLFNTKINALKELNYKCSDEELNEFKGQYYKEEKRIKRLKRHKIKVASIWASIVSLVIATCLFSIFYIYPKTQFDKANNLMAEGNFAEAENIYEGLNGWDDSETKLAIIDEYKKMSLGNETGTNFVDNFLAIEDLGADVYIEYRLPYEGGDYSFYSDSFESSYDGYSYLPEYTNPGYYILFFKLSSANLVSVDGQLEFNCVMTGYTGMYTYTATIYYEGRENLNAYDVINFNVQTDQVYYEYDQSYKEGYYLYGWEDDYGNISTYISIDYGTVGNRNFYAVYKPIEYSISYYLDGGSLPSSAWTTYTIEDTYVLPTPTKTGYTFRGWYIDDDTTQKISVLDHMMGDLRLYARYDKKSYSIVFNPNGGYFDRTRNYVEVTYHYNDYQYGSITRTLYDGNAYPDAVYNSDNIFYGWYLDSSYREKFNFTDPVNDDFDLYLKSEPIDAGKYKLDTESIYITNTDFSRTFTATNDVDNGTINLSYVSPSLSSFEFSVYNETQNYSCRVSNNVAYIDANAGDDIKVEVTYTGDPNDSRYFYVNFDIDYKTSLSNNQVKVIGSTSYKYESVTYQERIQLPNCNKDGYRFVGWRFNGTTYTGSYMYWDFDYGGTLTAVFE